MCRLTNGQLTRLPTPGTGRQATANGESFSWKYLAWIQDTLGIEQKFDSPHPFKALSMLFIHELPFADAHPVFTRSRAAHREGL
jgi:hypothetical protein